MIVKFLEKNIDAQVNSCYSKWAMEVGLFFMPKIRELIWRWKLCALESHWHVQNASSVITT